jgi:hypothetical protein
VICAANTLSVGEKEYDTISGMIHENQNMQEYIVKVASDEADDECGVTFLHRAVYSKVTIEFDVNLSCVCHVQDPRVASQAICTVKQSSVGPRKLYDNTPTISLISRYCFELADYFPCLAR